MVWLSIEKEIGMLMTLLEIIDNTFKVFDICITSFLIHILRNPNAGFLFFFVFIKRKLTDESKKNYSLRWEDRPFHLAFGK